jgi:hypothetical protein
MDIAVDGSLEIVATLIDVGFSTRHNFNLLSITSLWQQGWSTQSGKIHGLFLAGAGQKRGHCLSVCQVLIWCPKNHCSYIPLPPLTSSSRILCAHPNLTTAPTLLAHKQSLNLMLHNATQPLPTSSTGHEAWVPLRTIKRIFRISCSRHFSQMLPDLPQRVA